MAHEAETMLGGIYERLPVDVSDCSAVAADLISVGPERTD
jgi:hypothetical protein